MSEKWKQKILLIFPFAVLAAGMIFTATFFLHTYRQIAFEHTSALCETILANSPEAEPQLLAALKDYHSLTEQELRGNDYLENTDTGSMIFAMISRWIQCFSDSIFPCDRLCVCRRNLSIPQKKSKEDR